MGKVLRCDAALLRSGVTIRRIRKDRDNWQILKEPKEEGALYYEEMDIDLNIFKH